MPYHYTESGLQNVWLENGYREIDTPYGKGVAIEAVEELHQVIGRSIAQRSYLTGSQLRFLRKELGLSQRSLADILGCTDQNVSLWERRGRMPRAADRLVRLLYLEKVDGNVKIQHLLDEIANLDQEIKADDAPMECLQLKSEGGHWREAA